MIDLDDALREAHRLETIAELEDEGNDSMAAQDEDLGTDWQCTQGGTMSTDNGIQAERKILDQGEVRGRAAMAEHIVNELNLFGATELLKTVGFKHDSNLTQVILEKLRAGETVAVLKIYEPQDLPENQATSERARSLIH